MRRRQSGAGIVSRAAPSSATNPSLGSRSAMGAQQQGFTGARRTADGNTLAVGEFERRCREIRASEVADR